MRDSIDIIRQQYENYASEIDEAEQQVNEGTLQPAWDHVAPNTEHQDARDVDIEQQQPDQPGDHYDIGQDLQTAPPKDTLVVQANHELPDKEYRSLMQTLNQKQQQFLQSVLYTAKTSDEQQQN